MLSSSKQFGSLLLRGLPLLMGVLLLMVFGTSTANAQSAVFNSPNKVYVPLQHTISTFGDSAKYKLGAVKIIEGTGGTFGVNDSLVIAAPYKWRFVKDSAITVTVTGGHHLSIDSALTSKTQTILTGLKGSKAYTLKSKIDTGAIHLVFDTASTTGATTGDTVWISGLYVQSTDSAGKYDSSNLVYTSAKNYVSGTANVISVSGDTLIALPGDYNKVVFKSSTPSSVGAGSIITATVQLQDANGNNTTSSSAIPVVSPVLNGGITAGNGTLSGIATVTRSVTKDSVTYTALTYTKAEKIQLLFTAPGNTDVSGEIDVKAGAAAHISVALQSGKSDGITVDQNTAYTLTLTDKYFNPVSDTSTVAGSEQTNHGGVFAFDNTHTTNGQIGVTFNPSKFFVGADTLVLSSPSLGVASASQTHAIMINPGSLAGVIVDYAGTTTSAGSTEKIAAGETVYARAYLRDTYGNPIDASDTSAVSFSSTKGTLTQSGKVLVPSLTTSLYPNTNQTSTAIALPIVVSKKAGDLDVVTAQTKTGGYTSRDTITVRSNVPAKLKMVQIGVGDSSIVASKYAIATSIVFADTAWDSYGNLSVAPDASWKIAPKRSAYAINFSTNGLVKFDRAADTTAVDTIYLDATGAVNRTVASGTKSGIDTLKAWSAANSTVAASVPVYVTPDVYSDLVIKPSPDTTAIAGKTDKFTAEKQDQYGNHIDWGISGGITVGNTFSRNNPDNTPSATTDSAKTILTILKSAAHATIAPSAPAVIGTASKLGASVGGSLNYSFAFTAAPASADTAKFSVVLSPASADTIIVRSIPTGALASFKVTVLSDTTETAGKTISMTVVPYDVNNNRMYTYTGHGQILTLNHTAVSPIKGKESTYFFTYENSNSETDTTTSVLLSDTAFVNGTATFTIHKFAAEQDSMTTITFADTSANVSVTTKPFNFTPDIVDTTYGMWKIQVADTLKSTGSFNFTVTPCDQFGNVNRKEQVIVNISSNQTSGFNIGSNPKVITGPTVFDGTLSGAKGNMVIYVFNSGNSNMFTQSSPIAIDVLNGIENTNELPKEYALMQNYPNPFNPTTLIKYDLPKAGLVTLKVYDLLGREVATLINGNQAAGKYSVQFNASKLASGVYIYRIQSNNFSAVKKLMLLK